MSKDSPAFKVLIDMCVWLDLAKDYQQQPILIALDQLIRSGDVEFVLPRAVIDEFARHRDRVIADSARSMSSTLKRVIEAVTKFGDPRNRDIVLAQLDDVNHRLPTLGSAAGHTVSWIERIFAETNAKRFLIR